MIINQERWSKSTTSSDEIKTWETPDLWLGRQSWLFGGGFIRKWDLVSPSQQKQKLHKQAFLFHAILFTLGISDNFKVTM